MPDVFLVMARRWGLVLLLTLAGTAAAFLASLLSPKLYLGTATALPVNTAVNDKARIFNPNIDALYSEIGSADELDKIEGTAELDTVFLAVAAVHRLTVHYGLDTAAGDALEKAALLLKQSSNIAKTGYGELKIRVWDRSNEMAATLANALMQTINAIHERLQTENNRAVLQRLKEFYAEELASVTAMQKKEIAFEPAGGENGSSSRDSIMGKREQLAGEMLHAANSHKQLEEYANLISQYELAVRTSPRALLVVEQARSSQRYDRPKTGRNVALAFLASLLFSFLLAVFVESRNAAA